MFRESTEEHKATRDPNNPRDFLDVYLAEIERGVSPYFDQEGLELTCLDLFKVIKVLRYHDDFSSGWSRDFLDDPAVVRAVRDPVPGGAGGRQGGGREGHRGGEAGATPQPAILPGGEGGSSRCYTLLTLVDTCPMGRQ